MKDDKSGRLSDADREALFAHVSRRRANAPAPKAVAPSIPGPDGATDFATLPGYEAASWCLEAPEQNEVTK